MGARIIPFPHPHSITDAFGATVEVSHSLIAIQADMQRVQRAVAAAASDNLPGDAA